MMTWCWKDSRPRNKHLRSVRNAITPTPNNNYYLHAICLQLLLSGDISVNPGPVKNPCSACQKPVRKNHIKCIDMPILEYNNLSNSDEDWYCRTCTLPNFSDSYFGVRPIIRQSDSPTVR